MGADDKQRLGHHQLLPEVVNVGEDRTTWAAIRLFDPAAAQSARTS